jgi:probable phosphomutase (TIGR03848 family)
MTRIVLVRHAPTPETGSKLTGRLPGVGLGPAGEELARAAATALADSSPRAIVTSPVQRCVETAAIIAEHHKVEPEIDPGFEEVDFGRWQGRTLASLRKLKAWRAVQLAPSRFRFPDGESFVDVQARATDALERLATRSGTVVVCSHADVIKLIISHHLGQPLDAFQRIGISPASISVLDLEPGLPARVLAVNGRSLP